MKKITQYSALIFLVLSLGFASCGSESTEDQNIADSTGFPGDNFSLAGALEMFKNSKNLPDFEKKLNSKKNKVNNLDLNGDEKTDYIRVRDVSEKSAHAIVLQVLVDDNELQDVAVISIVKTDDKNATIQIIGDEFMYGDSAVFQPMEETKTEQAGFSVSLFKNTSLEAGVNVWYWPPVQYVYSPEYVVYASPVVWNVYPAWYQPWKPYPYGWYRREVAHMHKNYQPVGVFIPSAATMLYFPGRRNSPFVMNRYENFYKQNGRPKSKGKSYDGQGGNDKMKGPKQGNDNPGHQGSPKMENKSNPSPNQGRKVSPSNPGGNPSKGGGSGHGNSGGGNSGGSKGGGKGK
jgi:hypothetical protein